MHKIDMELVRRCVPKNCTITIVKNSLVFKCFFPSIQEPEFQSVKDDLRLAIGIGFISEIYTEEIGAHWVVFLERVPIEYFNV